MASDAAALGEIKEDLEFLKKQIAEIRLHMVDSDALLAEDERALLRKARDERARGETVPLSEFEKTRA